VEKYPEIEPYDHGMLDVGDGNLVYWEVCGNPEGKPAVVVHGGPGSGCSEGMRRTFDPEVYRVVLFDQRNCGRSTPNASEYETDLSTNTTDHLIADIERLREHLGIERWLVFGGSWGSTLGLAYAERHPHRVTEMVIVAVTTGRQSELDWHNRGSGMFFPEQWERFRAQLPEADRDGNLSAAYNRLLEDPDPAVRRKAADDWCTWDLATITGGDTAFEGRFADPGFRMTFARIVTHYFGNCSFLEDGIVLREAGKLAGIPAVLIHGRRDFGGPLITAWELAKAWPDAELVVVEEAGHTSTEPAMADAVLSAIARFGSFTQSSSHEL
jgi:proline iminopeptidase